MARSPKSVRRLLQDKPTLKTLDREVAAQRELLTQIRQCLPPELAAHCLNAQLRGARLTLHTDSAVWATRLRYLATQLISVLKHEHPGLREIKVKLLLERRSQPPRHAPAHRSEIAAALLDDMAGDIEEAPLRDALLRLSRSIKPQ
jgi:hypothetical protein